MVSFMGETANGFDFEGTLGRTYRVPYLVEIAPRSPNGRAAGQLGGLGRSEDGEICAVWHTPPRSRIAFESLEKDYDLTRFIVAGEPRKAPRDAREAGSGSASSNEERPREAPPEEPAGPSVSLASLAFDGDQLEVVELDGAGWVSFPSLLRPFGKRADSYMGLLEGWARTRVAQVPSRMGAGRDAAGRLRGNAGDVTLLHFEDAPLAIARLDRRGMEEATKQKHDRYLRECAKALADYFLRGRAENPRAQSREDKLDLVIGLLAEGQVTNRREIEAVDTKASRAAEDAAAARATAERAHHVAEEARTAAHAATNPTHGMAPGTSRRVPEGAVSSDGPPGFVSMRAVARRFILPADGEGANFVARVANSLRVDEIEGAVAFVDVVIGGSPRRSQRRFGPVAIERMRPALMAAHATMVAFGFEVTGDVMRARSVARRSKTWVLEQMLEAAVATSPRGPSADGQQSIPGVENDGAAKAS